MIYCLQSYPIIQTIYIVVLAWLRVVQGETLGYLSLVGYIKHHGAEMALLS